MAKSETRFSFTKELIEKLPTPGPGGRQVYWDDGSKQSVPGLQLRVGATGIKTFCLYRRTKGGGPERLTLGRFPAMTYEQARRNGACQGSCRPIHAAAARLC